MVGTGGNPGTAGGALVIMSMGVVVGVGTGAEDKGIDADAVVVIGPAVDEGCGACEMMVFAKERVVVATLGFASWEVVTGTLAGGMTPLFEECMDSRGRLGGSSSSESRNSKTS